MTVMPSLFLAHGAPDLPLSDHPAKRFLNTLPASIGRPKAIVVISAHWEAHQPTIGTATNPETVYDFAGWPNALYEIHYPARTDRFVIAQIGRCLSDAGIDVATHPSRGYDHGVWVPLALSYTQADIPVIQLSLVHRGTAAEHFKIGLALANLRADQIMIVGSGATVHNLRRLAPEGSLPQPWAIAFEEWLEKALAERDLDTLLSFPGTPQEALTAHPTPEHFLPFYVALGAGWESGGIERIHHSFSYGSVGMACYKFGGGA
jgi:4,5-DOPA dioxygenase extradiol